MDMTEITRVIESVQRGEACAADELLPLVYGELRRIAAAKMAREPAGHTLQATALVHEAWLRLVGNSSPEFQGRNHFFAAAAEAMRRILIDSARRKQSIKRGGDSARAELEEADIVQTAPSDEMLAVDEALNELAAEDPALADLVKLRYFVGMSMEEAATALGLPLRTVERQWTYAKAWLRERIGSARS